MPDEPPSHTLALLSRHARERGSGVRQLPGGGQKGASFAFEATVGEEYTIQVTGDDAPDFGVYDLLVTSPSPFSVTKISSTSVHGKANDDGRGPVLTAWRQADAGSTIRSQSM
jgi:hypothetical protein